MKPTARSTLRQHTLWVAIAAVVIAEILAIRAVGPHNLRGWLSSTLGQHYNTVIVMAGAALLGLASGVIGSFAVLRRRALVGDAASHAALPGICIAFMLIGDRDFGALLLGALGSGLAGVVAINWLTRRARIKSDAAIGIVLSVFFGLGIAMSRYISGNPAWAANATGLDSFLLGKTAGMIADDLLMIALIALNVLLLIAALYKEFRLISFDADFAAVQGFPVLTIDLALTGAIVVTVVIGLPAVGVVLMAALLILPGVSARFWTDRLGRMLTLAAVFGLATGVVGTWLSVQFHRLPAGPMIVLAGGVIFLGSLLLAPRRGAIARLIQRIRLERRVARQNLLRSLWPEGAVGLTIGQLLERRAWSHHHARRLLENAERNGDVSREGERWRLTPDGQEHAARVEAAHRLQQLLLTEYASGEADIFHRDADEIGQHVPATLLRELEDRLRSENRWPLGERSLAR